MLEYLVQYFPRTRQARAYRPDGGFYWNHAKTTADPQVRKIDGNAQEIDYIVRVSSRGGSGEAEERVLVLHGVVRE